MNSNIKYYSNGILQKQIMINNHIKSWHTEKANYRDGIPPIHGFFMATRRQLCLERQERRIVTNTENKKEEII
jgi:hypothetical protein